MALHLSESTIRARLLEWRNLKKLHEAARQRVESLLGEVKRLKEKLSASDEEKAALKEDLRKKDETVGKLQKMLFERQAPRTRMQRAKESIVRDAASYRRPLPVRVDLRKTVSLKQCPDCGSNVSAVQSSRTRLVEDIVLNPKTVVTEWTVQRHFCAHCDKLVEADVPGVLPRAMLGPNTLTLAVIAKYRWNLPYEKIRDVLSLSYGLIVSDGEIAHLLSKAQELTGEKWNEITEAVRLGKRVHCDETGWYVDGEKGWAHVFSTKDVTLYVIHETRGKGVAERALGNDFKGTRISDCLANYKNLSGDHQICWEHLTREAFDNNERERNEERILISSEFDAIYARLREETSAWEAAPAKKAKRWCEQKVATLGARSWHDPPSRRLVERLENFRSALFTCLDHPGIPPDNNEAERCLRKLAVQRKISGGNRSWKHALIHAQLMSVIETLRKEGTGVLDGLQLLVSAGIEKRLSGG
jgi:transposase